MAMQRTNMVAETPLLLKVEAKAPWSDLEAATTVP
jgi:hypothetical protein